MFWSAIATLAQIFDLFTIYFNSKTGFRCRIEYAPEAIRNLFLLISIIISSLRSAEYSIILIDHVEEHVTPPTLELFLNSIIEYMLKRNNAMLVMSVHGLDTYVTVVNTILNTLGKLNIDPEKYENYITVYEFKPENDHVEVVKLPIDPKLGAKLPEYLTEYAKLILKSI